MPAPATAIGPAAWRCGFDAGASFAKVVVDWIALGIAFGVRGLLTARHSRGDALGASASGLGTETVSPTLMAGNV